MIKYVAVVVIVIGFLILSIPLLLIEWLIGKKHPNLRDRQSLKIVQSAFRLILKLVGAKITVKGMEHIPMDQAVLYVGNHRSYFDILVGYVTTPTLIGFVAKKEMAAYPLLVDWMKNVNCIFLNRENLKEALKTIFAGIEKVKQGISIWIFPEGTRSRNEDILEMLPFKEGSLKIAEKSGCPVIPVAITGTAEIFEKQYPRMKSSQVTIEFGIPILMRELEPEQRKFAGAYIQSIIKQMLQQEKTVREGR
ncbi:MAG: lysophospholipid acyltransferase family protein [Hungatella sp.]